LAITKSIENGLITFGQKEIVLKTIHEIVNHSELEICFRGNTVMNEQTIIQKKKCNQTGPYSCRKNNEVFR
jgi:hypothetical protein